MATSKEATKEEVEISHIEKELLPEHIYDPVLLTAKQELQILNNHDSAQRFLQYSLADAKFEEDYISFCSNTKSLTTDERKQLFTFISTYINKDVADNEVMNLIPTFDRFLFEFLPCKYAPIIGAAGTGKTTSTANMIFKQNTITVCGATNSAFGSFMSQLQQNVKPGSYSKITKETIYKLARIKFDEPFVRQCLEDLDSNCELHTSYIELIKHSGSVENKAETQRYICGHLRVILKALRPLLHFTTQHLIMCYNKYHKQFRLTITDKLHPYYQDADETFSFIKQNTKQITDKKAARLCNSVRTLDGYQSLVLMQCNENCFLPNQDFRLPNILTLVNTIIVEEAGKLNAYFNIIAVFLWWFLQFVYNTPMLYETLPILSPSGSDSQSSVINFPVSMLDEAICPTIIWDPETVLAYKSEHNRRKINAFTDLKTAMHNTACLSLENFKVNEFTYKSFMFSETFPQLVDNPRIKPNAIRMFAYHKKCNNFIKAMHTQGNATIETRDNIFVSSDVTLINHTLYDESDNTTEELSILSEKEAQDNRLKMWKEKIHIYKEGYIAEDEQYKRKLTCSTSLSTDTGFNKEVENSIQALYAKLHTATCGVKRTHGKKSAHHIGKSSTKKYMHHMSDDQIDDIEYRETMQREMNEVYNNNNNDDGKHEIRFICGPAKLMLSREEHRMKRMHGNGIARELGYGKELSKQYYSSSIAQGQTTEMEYDPKYDICIEIADPDYTRDDSFLQESIDKTICARPVYMCISRKRYFPPLSCVVSGAYKTSITLQGVSGAVKDIIYSECFTSSNLAFRLLVYSCLLDEYRKWVYSIVCKDGSIDILNMERQYVTQLGHTLNVPVAEKEIIDSYERVVSLSCNRERPDYKYEDPNNNGKTVLDTLKLHDSLKRLVMKVLNLSHEFGNRNVQHYIENCELLNSWRFLFYKATKPFFLDKTQYGNWGDLVILDEGDVSYTRNNKFKQCSQSSIEWEKRMIGKKNFHRIINTMVQNLFPDLINATSMTLLVKGALIAKTHPSLLHKHLHLFEILGPKNSCKPSRFGIMMRSNAANIQQRPNMLMQKIYSINGGESVNFPRPFIVGGTDIPTNIVLKCKDKVFYFSSLQNDTGEKIPAKKVESFAVLSLMNPLFVEGAFTVDSMQGKTTSGETMVDLNDMSCSKHLVAVTRNNCTHNLITSNVSLAMNNKTYQSQLGSIKITNRKLTTKYFKYR